MRQILGAGGQVGRMQKHENRILWQALGGVVLEPFCKGIQGEGALGHQHAPEASSFSWGICLSSI